jgi:L-amino acid N-acyltransferase YncA
MKNIKVRKAEKIDAEGIAHVHIKSWQCAYKGQIPDSILDNLSLIKKTERWKEILNKPKEGVYNFVAEADTKIIGWCSVNINRDNDLNDEVGELYGIYIDPDYMSEGAGSSLMNVALDQLKKDGYKKATLWVLDTNIKTRSWYEYKGWKVEGKTKKDNKDDFVLNQTRYIIDLG